MEEEKSGEIKIFLLVQLEHVGTSHSLYLIEPPIEKEPEIDSDGFILDSISPINTIERGDKCCFLPNCGMSRLGSCFYFFGGYTDYYLEASTGTVIPDELKLMVQVFDIDHPELGFRKVASLNAHKETPCVFSAHNRIYALGSRVRGCNLTGSSGRSGIFERYDPDKDYWEVLPDPPKPFGKALDIIWSDCATVVQDRYVYVGNWVHDWYFVFDLNVEKWTSISQLSRLIFPCGSLYVSHSLYYLTGLGSWKLGTQFGNYYDTINYFDDDNEVRLVRRSPLVHLNDDDPSGLLMSNCLKPGNEQVMSTFAELEHDTWFSTTDFSQWRDIYHLGDRFFCYVSTSQLVNLQDDRFFCYVSTSQLVNLQDPRLDQPDCRGVWIKVFEEIVPDPNSTTEQPHFRILASFSYRIRTPFHNATSFIRCCAFGSVPQSWIKAPLSQKVVAAKKREASKAEQRQHEHDGGSEGQRDGAWVKAPLKKEQGEALKTEHSHGHGGGGEGQTDDYLHKILAAREEEISRLTAELAEKDKLLEEYKSLLAKSKGKLMLGN